MSEIQKMPVMDTIKDGMGIGIKNIGTILVNLLLWILTCWIPYLNVGTTIGLYVGIISKAAKGEEISFTEIFNPLYRKYMGEYFLVTGLTCVGITIGFMFFVIPGIVISLAWFFAALITIDKEKNPVEAITVSNKITYGNKGRMFGILLLVSLIFFVILSILTATVGFFDFGVVITALFLLIMLALVLFMCVIMIGIQASMYKQLASNI
ncbi:MAG: hypothetical protein FWC22_07415 [Treponema sp.]|nr:hypothetical protein [Treponema sp.]